MKSAVSTRSGDSRKRLSLGARPITAGALLSVIASLFFSTVALGSIVDFDSEPLGAIYGTTTGYAPGDLAFIQNNTPVTVEEFYFVPFPSGPIFLDAEIVEPPHIFAAGTDKGLATGNINARFDFSNLPGEVHKARLQFVDFGGNENFDINGLGPFSEDDLFLLPPIPGFNVTVSTSPLPTGGVRGTLLVEQTGSDSIKSLMIGGQEFGIDNVEAPIAGDLNGDGLINFADLNGMTWALSDRRKYAAAYPNLDGVTRCDANGDGACNFADLDGLVDLLTGAPAAGSGSASGVPEPASCTLAGLLTLVAVATYRRRQAA